MLRVINKMDVNMENKSLTISTLPEASPGPVVETNLHHDQPNPDNTNLPAHGMADVDDVADFLHRNYLFHLCKPFMALLRIGGMFFVQPGLMHPKTPSADSKITKGHQRWMVFETVCKYYSLVIFLVVLAFSSITTYNFASVLQNFTFSNQTLGVFFNNLLHFIWVWQLAVVHFITLKRCWNKFGMFTFFFEWVSLRYTCPFETTCLCAKFSSSFKSRVWFMVAIAVTHLALIIVFSWAPFVIPYGDFAAMKMVFFAGIGGYPLDLYIFDIIATFYMAFVFIIPTYLFITIAFVIIFDFYHLTYDMKYGLNHCKDMPTRIEWFRLRHNSLCILLDTADSNFSSLILLIFSCNILQVLVGIFCIVDGIERNEIGIISGCVTGFYLLTYAAQVLLIFGAGSSVHKHVKALLKILKELEKPNFKFYLLLYMFFQAHSALPVLFQLQSPSLSMHQTLHLQTFINKLTCNVIGFSAWKMLTIDSATLLALIGTYVTYQILLFQLQLDFNLQAKIDELPVCPKCPHLQEGGASQTLFLASHANVSF